MPSFDRYPQEAALIGKLVTGYGELEYILALTVRWIINDQDVAIRWLYKSRGESQRISTAEALTYHVLRRHRHEATFAEAINGMRHCLAIRNQYAHATWVDSVSQGLKFTSMEGVVHQDGTASPSKLRMRRVSEAHLVRQEAYFVYVQHQFEFINFEFQHEGGHISIQPCGAPSKVSRPNL